MVAPHSRGRETFFEVDGGGGGKVFFKVDGGGANHFLRYTFVRTEDLWHTLFLPFTDIQKVYIIVAISILLLFWLFMYAFYVPS